MLHIIANEVLSVIHELFNYDCPYKWYKRRVFLRREWKSIFLFVKYKDTSQA